MLEGLLKSGMSVFVCLFVFFYFAMLPCSLITSTTVFGPKSSVKPNMQTLIVNAGSKKILNFLPGLESNFTLIQKTWNPSKPDDFQTFKDLCNIVYKLKRKRENKSHYYSVNSMGENVPLNNWVVSRVKNMLINQRAAHDKQ